MTIHIQLVKEWICILLCFFFIHNSCHLPLWSHAISGNLVIYVSYDQSLVTWTNFKTFFFSPPMGPLTQDVFKNNSHVFHYHCIELITIIARHYWFLCMFSFHGNFTAHSNLSPTHAIEAHCHWLLLNAITPTWHYCNHHQFVITT